MNKEFVEAIAALATERGLKVAAAESLTGGAVTSALAQGPDASEWLCGGVVSYRPEVKFDLLGVTPGPLVTAECASQMAAGAARVLEADATVSTTGVGGPGEEEGEPPGTVYIAVSLRGDVHSRRFELEGDPADIVERATDRALEMLLEILQQ